MIVIFIMIFIMIIRAFGMLFQDIFDFIFQVMALKKKKQSQKRTAEMKKLFHTWKHMSSLSSRRKKHIEALKKIEHFQLRRAFAKFVKLQRYLCERRLHDRIQNLENQVDTLNQKISNAQFYLKHQLVHDSVSSPNEPFSHFPPGTFLSPSYKQKLDEKLPPFYLRAPPSHFTFDGETFTPSSVSPISIRSSISSAADPITTENLREHTPVPIGPRISRAVSHSSIFSQPHLEVDRNFDLMHFGIAAETYVSDTANEICSITKPKMNPFAPAWTPNASNSIVMSGIRRSDEEIGLIKDACRAVLLCYHFHLHGRCVRGTHCKFAHNIIDDAQLLEKYEECTYYIQNSTAVHAS